MTPGDAKKAAAGGAAAALRIHMLTELDLVLESMRFDDRKPVPFDEGDAEMVRTEWIEIVKELCHRGAVRCCRICGCTDALACTPDGCEWIGEELCSAHGEGSPSPIDAMLGEYRKVFGGGAP